LTQQKSGLTNEEWRDIPGYDGYQASSEGRILRKDSGKILKQSMRQAHSRIYLMVSLGHYITSKGNRAAVTAWVHRLVCLAFHGVPKDSQVHACHVPNNDPFDNRANNLAWGSRAWNESHKNGNAMCTCDHVYGGHMPEDEGGYCTEMIQTKKGKKHCPCMGFEVKQEEVAVVT
jgi:hypothetical protein